MKNIKSFKLYEKEFNSDFYKENPDFYLNKSKERNEAKKEIKILFDNIDISTIKFIQTPEEETWYRLEYPKDFYDKITELYQNAYESELKYNIPDYFYLNNNMLQINGYIEDLTFKTKLVAEFINTTGLLIEIPNDISKKIQHLFPDFYYIQKEYSTYVTTDKEKYEDMYNSIPMDKLKKINKDKVTDSDTYSKFKNILKNIKWTDLVVRKHGQTYDVQLPQELRDEFYKTFKNEKVEIKFQVYPMQYNRIHTDPDGLSMEFRGLGLGYKQYKAVIKHVGWVRSDHEESIQNSQNIWYKLSQDPDFYTMVIIDDLNKNEHIFAFHKGMDIEEVKEIITNIQEDAKGKIILDNDLKGIILN